ncbi:MULTISPECIES: hypothetical protein [Gammaproteobacteria]|uniref:hypothetical protein n=1 Tax=Gammaproteobacteria TaxID=1236 RepID=UPI0002BB5017|nr:MULTISPECIES: hypothetical protein [Acinetobacter]CAH1079995.1 putative phage regultory protein [Acinetobacter phage MD-2021a]ARG36204.1 hypothetical protein B7L46_15275 [Acinetobacter baumannii]AVN29135.1 hypothetical protein AM467_06775 [Acinetobacter baumannii]EME5680982.1 hypothetical protein [Acinetobacter baumannii]EXH11916.1 putative regulatory protein [Acinetobacter sp. 1245593]
MSTIKEVINDAGGVCSVAFAVQLSERSIYKWIEKNCLPRSEYTGESNYSNLIAKLCKKFSEQEILEIGNPRKAKSLERRDEVIPT